MIKTIFNKLKDMEHQTFLFVIITIICTSGVIAFLNFYFDSYRNPYMQNDIIDLSAGWQYHIGDNSLRELENLRHGPELLGGQMLILYKTLDIELPEAAILIRANHQTVTVYLDDVPLLSSGEYIRGANPGMALHFILLPEDYRGKTLKMEVMSPYLLYAGRTSPVMMGSITSLEAYTISKSMRSVILMAMCLLIGFCTIALTLFQGLKGIVEPQNLFIGIFAVVWALYYICTEYIVFQFFTPVQMSIFSLGLYFSFQAPLALFFFFSFERYKKWLLHAVILHVSFAPTAFILQFLNIIQMPQLINVNNVILAVGILYILVLSIMEAIKKNRRMALAAPFLTIAYISMLYNFSVFYGRSGVVPYSYRDTYFLLILSILIYNVQQFFIVYYRQQREAALLNLQNQLAKESYEQVKTNLLQVGSIKHEMKSHMTALQSYLDSDLYEEAKKYIGTYVQQTQSITESVHHENFLINAVVGRLLHAAEKMGIKVSLNLKSCHIGITDPDLYSLLNNILQNALTACTAVPREQKRFIHLIISRKEPYLHITCENSKTGEIISRGGVIHTSKSDHAGHGYGLWIVSSIVDAYDGIMDTEYDEHNFRITVALKDKQ